MFKKKCKRCGKRIRENYNFCPYCGFELNKRYKKEDWGLLGKNDFISDFEEIPGINSMFSFLMKNINKLSKIDKVDKEFQPIKKGISISISSFENGKPKIKIKHFGDNKNKIKKLVRFSEEKAKEFAKLPKEEPRTNIKRFSNKIIYEIEVPGVKKLEDVSMVKLESSTEIKAIAKDKAYSKIIPINLPIFNYTLSEGKLILEFRV